MSMTFSPGLQKWRGRVRKPKQGASPVQRLGEHLFSLNWSPRFAVQLAVNLDEQLLLTSCNMISVGHVSCSNFGSVQRTMCHFVCRCVAMELRAALHASEAHARVTAKQQEVVHLQHLLDQVSARLHPLLTTTRNEAFYTSRGRTHHQPRIRWPAVLHPRGGCSLTRVFKI